ncbi:Pectate lyase [Thalictrum thalictroides]|uniref:Pectate lyase n=1 Tax=Thalictrum thalictroides TaxID=46969 RepID=A0A7J6V0A8_THATH|nr:Pectate lyase [Thalictrum thalictroides]
MLLRSRTCILLLLYLLSFFSPFIKATHFNLTLPHQHPYPELVVQDVQRRLNASISRRQLIGIEEKDQASCLTGNPIDDCWRCDPNWQENRQRLADCGIGFGQNALGGKGGRIYVVTDSSDNDPVNPPPGTLRHAVIQTEPLWIIFSANMLIKLNEELIVNSFKTIDGRGVNVHIVGGGCITLQFVTNIIIHNIHIHHCVPSGNANVRSSPTHYGYRTRSDGDGISIYTGRKIWIDHCSLSYCKDGLIDAIMGSTGITISNSYFSHHNEVMLLGHNDNYLPDSGMQVTIAFNHFGEELVQRMPRCRHGYFHIVNNDFTHWEMYAIGGSANPTINSQGNRYNAPVDPNAKEVTKRVLTDEKEWNDWNWRTDGDMMVNGAFFVPSGFGLGQQYAQASSVEPKSAGIIDQLTMNAGVMGGSGNRDNSRSISYPGFNNGGTSTVPGVLVGPGGGGEGEGGGGGGNDGLVAHPINPNPTVPVISESSSDEESEDETDSFTSDEETESDSEEISDSDSLEEDEDDSSYASLEDEECGSSDDEVVFVGENNVAADAVPGIEEINGDPEGPMVVPPDQVPPNDVATELDDVGPDDLAAESDKEHKAKRKKM